MSNVLFDFESQFREKRTLWRLFELAPSRYELAHGRIFRWFGINIPFSLVGGQEDVDLLMSLKDLPARKFAVIYETLELKATLITRHGKAISPKAGPTKTKHLVGQLSKYRELGSPPVGPLEIYVCEDGFFETQQPLPREVRNAIASKRDSPSGRGFGYTVVVMQYDRPSERERAQSNYFGLRTLQRTGFPSTPMIRVLPPLSADAHVPFTQLIEMMETFVNGETTAKRVTLGKCIVTYCHRSRTLITVDHKGDYRCGNCGDALVMQTS